MNIYVVRIQRHSSLVTLIKDFGNDNIPSNVKAAEDYFRKIVSEHEAFYAEPLEDHELDAALEDGYHEDNEGENSFQIFHGE